MQQDVYDVCESSILAKQLPLNGMSCKCQWPISATLDQVFLLSKKTGHHIVGPNFPNAIKTFLGVFIGGDVEFIV